LFTAVYPLALCAAAAKAAAIANLSDAWADREDMVQEAMIAVCQGLVYYEPARATLRTFTERIIDNRMTSLFRCRHARRRGHGRNEPLTAGANLAAPDRHLDLRADVTLILAGMSLFDRKVAAHLIDCTPAETSRCLGVSRAAVYRAIARLRLAFITAGIQPADHEMSSGECRRADGRRCQPDREIRATAGTW